MVDDQNRATGPEVRLSYADIDNARTVFEWGGQPKPGSNQSTRGGSKNPTRTKRARAS